MEKKFNDLTQRYNTLTNEEMIRKSATYLEEMKKRRTIRFFSDKEVPLEVIENCLKTASTAPSGANCQPWHFAVVTDPKIKSEIRKGCEGVEKDFYSNKAPQQWLDALAPLETNDQKPFLDIAPYIIVIFVKKYDVDDAGDKKKQYYYNESIGIAAGMLITALHTAGLGILTYTPSPMRFLNRILGRPDNERAFMVLVTGHPAMDCNAPDLERKSLKEIATFL